MSLPTTHKMAKKHDEYVRKLEHVTEILKEKGISHEELVESGSTDEEDDIHINPVQGSGAIKNISDLSCSDDCLCDRCLHIKCAATNRECQPVGYSTPVEEGACRIEFMESQDEFDLKDVALSYLSDVCLKLDRLSNRLDVCADEDFILQVVDKLEKCSLDINSLL